LYQFVNYVINMHWFCFALFTIMQTDADLSCGICEGLLLEKKKRTTDPE